MGKCSRARHAGAGIQQLPAGHSLRYKDGKQSLSSYWRLKFGDAPSEPGNAAKQVRDGLIESLERHFVADVPVGLFLSGVLIPQQLLLCLMLLAIRI